jgi:Ni,Fe-hydrogenase III small subunit
MAYPDAPPPEPPERWRGMPVVPPEATASAENVCPTGAFAAGRLDAGKCIFCGACGVMFSRDYALSRFTRDDLLVTAEKKEPAPASDRVRRIRSLFGRSLKLRQVSAGGCNACEADCNVLGTPAWDMGRFGISFVASPRHADGILVTGPVTDNMKLALEKTYAAVPAPKIVIAAGACAVSGGLYGDGSAHGVLDSIAPVDLYIPGCPPHPLTILEGLLRLIGRVEDI